MGLSMITDEPDVVSGSTHRKPETGAGTDPREGSMPRKHQSIARVMTENRRAFRPADLAVFGALVIAALLIAVGIAHSDTQTIAVKSDRAPIAAPMSPATVGDTVTKSDTDPMTGTTTLTRTPAEPRLL
jgi:hypothetical protein